MFCTKCGAELPNDATNCSQCGAPVNENVNTQSTEGTQSQTNQQANNNQQAGTNYGYTTPNQPQQGSVGAPKSKLAAGLLNIFLAGIGRLYLGYTGIGIAQLLLAIFGCGTGAIWSLIDGILILTGTPDVDANGNPLSE